MPLSIAGDGSRSFCPAYFEPGPPARLTLFPMKGPAITAPLPKVPWPLTNILASGSDERDRFLSPDGQWVVSKSKRQLTLRNVISGEVRVIPGTNAGTKCCIWSPNGKSMLAITYGKIILIAVDGRSRPKKLGGAGHAGVVWSPDSKYLLIRKPQLSCMATLYFESLEVIDVETGKRTIVKSSHCNILSGSFGWLDQSAVQ